jgi:proliferating cell nuclear antigen
MRIREQVIRSCYPIEYLLKILKAVTAVTEMDIHYRTDYPMELDFKLPEVVAKTRGYYLQGEIPVRYLLAPRMEQ